MRIDKNTKIVFEVEAESGATYFVHSDPISRDIFELYYETIGRTWAELVGSGQAMLLVTGPRIAYLKLREIARNMGVWEGEGGVENGLVAEIRRRTNVILPGEGGWQVLPYQTVINQKKMTEEDAAEVDGQLAFFTCAFSMGRRKETGELMDRIEKLWSLKTTSSNCTEFKNSLNASTVEQTSPNIPTT